MGVSCCGALTERPVGCVVQLYGLAIRRDVCSEVGVPALLLLLREEEEMLKESTSSAKIKDQGNAASTCFKESRLVAFCVAG